MKKFEVVRSKRPNGTTVYVVRERAGDGKTAWLWCHCDSETRANLIAESLNVSDELSDGESLIQGLAA